MKEVIKDLKNGLIVSCEAYEDEPLYGGDTVTRLAIAAEEGGAVAIKTSGIKNIKSIKENVKIPVIGSIRIIPEEFDKKRDVIITPTILAAETACDLGVDILSFDCTIRNNRSYEYLKDFIKSLKIICDIPLMAEISTLEEAVFAAENEVDIISTSLSRDVEGVEFINKPDKKIVENISKITNIPINSEGKITNYKEAVDLLKAGAYSVTVGSAITRPQTITKRFVDYIN